MHSFFFFCIIDSFFSHLYLSLLICMYLVYFKCIFKERFISFFFLLWHRWRSPSDVTPDVMTFAEPKFWFQKKRRGEFDVRRNDIKRVLLYLFHSNSDYFFTHLPWNSGVIRNRRQEIKNSLLAWLKLVHPLLISLTHSHLGFPVAYWHERQMGVIDLIALKWGTSRRSSILVMAMH